MKEAKVESGQHSFPSRHLQQYLLSLTKQDAVKDLMLQLTS